MKSELYEALAQRLQDAGLSGTACAAVDMIDAAYVIRTMQSRIEALEKDAARLDWLESSKEMHAFCHTGYDEYRYYAHQQDGCKTVREVIDTAMQRTTAQEGEQ